MLHACHIILLGCCYKASLHICCLQLRVHLILMRLHMRWGKLSILQWRHGFLRSIYIYDLYNLFLTWIQFQPVIRWDIALWNLKECYSTFQHLHKFLQLFEFIWLRLLWKGGMPLKFTSRFLVHFIQLWQVIFFHGLNLNTWRTMSLNTPSSVPYY